MGNVCPFQIQCGDSLINQCWDCTAGQAAYICQLEDNLEALQTATQELRELKDDLLQRLHHEERWQMKRLEQVQGWLSRVETMIADVDELTRHGPQETEKLCLGGCWSKNCKSSYIFGKRVAKKLKDVVALKMKGEFKVVVERETRERVIERPTEPTEGLEHMLDEVWNCLIDEEVGIIGICGMGGVGKTTLLAQINNRFLRRTHDFDVVIWVVVSKDLRLEKVQDEIAKRLGLSDDQQWKNKTFSEKTEDVFSVLQKMKFVLLLDDVWKRVELKEVGVPILKRQNRSKVVFTTRSQAVCSRMDAEKKIKVETLGWEQAWRLFKDKVGEDALCTNPEIPRIAKDVAKECGGLPLALITIGRAMACKKTLQEWKHAVEILRKSASNLQGMRDEVFPVLKFSYDCLPNEKVKSCLLYCTLFPEDFKIPKEDLVEHWIYENFWPDDSDNELDSLNEGYNIIGILVRACLLEDEGSSIKMHDVIRDMAIWIACEVEKEKESYLVQAGAQLLKAPKMGRWKGVRRISLMENKIEQLTEMPTCPELLSLFMCCNRNLKMITSGFFQSMKALTVLDLSMTGLRYLPAEISELVSLQYLNLSRGYIEELPCELRKLTKLKYLNLDWSERLRKIPRHMISSLPLLEVLRMFGCSLVCSVEDKGDVNVEELQGLEHLKVSSFTIRHAFVFHYLLNSCKLLSCTQALLIVLEGVMYSEITSHYGDSEELNVDLMMTERARTGTLGGLYNPANLGKKCFDSLHTVTVSACLYLRDLTWLVRAPNLKDLKVTRCRKLEEIISFEKLGEEENHTLFSKLEVLKLEDLPQLKSIYWKALPLSCLEEIGVVGCPLLKKLPLNSSSARGSKVVITAHRHWWDNVVWEDDATKTAFQFCFCENGSAWLLQRCGRGSVARF